MLRAIFNAPDAPDALNALNDPNDHNDHNAPNGLAEVLRISCTVKEQDL